MKFNKTIKVHKTAIIESPDIKIGDYSVIGAGVRINAGVVRIGRAAWIDENAVIGGGRAELGSFAAGDFLHVGQYAHLNTAGSLIVGDEVGLGIGTRIFTHGAYLNELDGFPHKVSEVIIGSQVWIPHAWVNPGVWIGDNVVIAAFSVVNDPIPAGSLAAGVPAKIIRENEYPKQLTLQHRAEIIKETLREFRKYSNEDYVFSDGMLTVFLGDNITIFDMLHKTLEGEVTEESELYRNVLRRHGIRFPFENVDGRYKSWIKGE